MTQLWPIPRAASPWNSPLLVPMFNRNQRWLFRAMFVLWLLLLAYFWSWWLQPQHVIETSWFVLSTIVLVWLTLPPFYFLMVFRGAMKPPSDGVPPEGACIAMVVTKAPSEPFYVVQKTLRAMLAQELPDGMNYDVWLADEAPDAETIAWCRAHGVLISSRQGVQEYHREAWPRRTRCKEGNLAYFYDHYGYEAYDFVSQLDADHVPDPSYLRHMMAPFRDPAIGYVSAPSICDANASHSWASRCRLYTEGLLHGALQAGYNRGWAPLCIGSHYAVRTKALKEIGGLGPELAEDHSTSLMMNAHGWKGIHAVDAIAHGDGPLTFTDLVTQEFQWSRSLVSILLNYSSRYVPSLPWKLKFQFLFCQIWYPLYSGFLAVMFLLPIIALVRQEAFVAVTFPAFLAHFLPPHLLLIALTLIWKRNGWLRPVNSKPLNWEPALFLLIRWPWALAGSISAVIDRVRGGFVDFKITPKGHQQQTGIPWRVLSPYIVLAMASLAPLVLIRDAHEANGFFIFAAINALSYALIITIIVIGHSPESKFWSLSVLRERPVQLLTAIFLFCSPIAALGTNGPLAVEALSYGADPLTLTRSTYPAAGAGSQVSRQVRLTFEWRFNNPPPRQPKKILGQEKGEGPTIGDKK